MSKIENHHDLIGAIVWDMVLGENTFAGRDLYLLVGLTPRQLFGISKMFPTETDGREIRLAIDPDIDPVILNDIPTAHQCNLPPVRIRNHANKNIVIMAPADENLDEVGASLGSVARIDPTAIQTCHNLWEDRMVTLCHLNEYQQHKDWLGCMIRGLDRSEIDKTLDQTAEFIWEFIKKEGEGVPWTKRIGELASILHLPKNCIPKRAVPEVGGRNVSIEIFKQRFTEACKLYGRIPYLLDPKDDPIDCTDLQKKLSDLLQEDSSDLERIKTVEVVNALIDDRFHLRHGDWRLSQQRFCQEFDWSRFGDKVFGKPKPRKSRKLEEQTSEFFQTYHPGQQESVREWIDDYTSSPDTRKIEAFLDQYESHLQLNKDGLKLYQKWRKVLFSKKETGEVQDLLSAIILGVIKLVAANSNADICQKSKLLLTVKNPDSRQTWSDLDRQTYDFFCLEARLIEGVLGDLIKYRLGRWLDSETIDKAKPKDSKQAQTLELELGFYRDGDFDPDTERVRIFWRPANGKNRPVSMLFPKDVKNLQNGIHKGKGIRLYLEPLRFHDTVSLKNLDSLLNEDGRPIEWTANPGGHCDMDLLDQILEEFGRIEDSGEIYDLDPTQFREALLTFREAMTLAIETLNDRPDEFYDADEADQASQVVEAFGNLCHEAGKKLSRSSEGRHLLQQIVEIGVACIGKHDKFLVIPAWHPLRLYERGEKIRHARKVIEVLFQYSHEDSLSDVAIDRILQNFNDLMNLWGYPEIVLNREKIFTCIEHSGGYSLAMPASQASEWLNDADTLSEKSCDYFMRTVDEYLAFNSHTESHFTAMLYNTDAKSLPPLMAQRLEERMETNPAFRCGLLITHQDRQKVRQIYADQTVRFQKEEVRSPAASFLSHLRVDIRENIDEKPHGKADLVFLHESFFAQSRIGWDVRQADTEMASDICSLIWPRRQKVSKNTQKGERFIAIDLVPDSLPECVTQFLNLCYLAHQSGAMIEPSHCAIPVRQLKWGKDVADPVNNLIRSAHEAGVWVVTFDQVASRAMLTDNDIKVIRDVHIGGFNARFLISSKGPSNAVKRHVEEILGHLQAKSSHGLNTKTMANQVIARVVDVCGQKVLAAGRLSRTAKEIVGLSAAVSLVDMYENTNGQSVLWLSLDDIGSAIGIRNGKMADLMALTLRGADDGRFQIGIRVVEAKCVACQSADKEMEDAVSQVEQTIELLASHLTQIDMARREWNLALSRILCSRDEFSDWSDARQNLLLQALRCGQVDFSLSGTVVVTRHDDNSIPSIDAAIATETKSGFPISGYMVKQKGLVSLMEYLVSPEKHEDKEIQRLSNMPSPKIVLPYVRHQSFADVAQKHPVNTNLDQKSNLVQKQPERDQQPTGMQEQPKNPDVSRLSTEIYSKKTNLDHIQGAQEENQKSGHKAFWQKLSELALKSRPPEELEREFQEAMDLAKKLRRALMDFGMHSEFSNLTSDPVTCTPNGVIVRFKGHKTLTIKDADKKRLEMLTTYGINVTDIRPGPGEIGFFIAYRKRQIVDLPCVWLEAQWPDTCPEKLTSFLIGIREDTGQPLWLNLTEEWGGYRQHAPHTLIAGETGSGKGVLMQNLLLQMIAFNDPVNLKIHLIDPKFGLDYDWIREAPHLDGDIVIKQDEARDKIQQLVEEMEVRYNLIASAKAGNIEVYNRMQNDQKTHLPRIILIHDEMADWMAGCEDYRKDVSADLIRIASKGRACGIHLFLITQRASQDAVPMHVRNNLGNKLCLKVDSKAGSEMILGYPGAERLLGKGHLASNLNGDAPEGQNYYVSQVPYITPESLMELARNAIEAWRDKVVAEV